MIFGIILRSGHTVITEIIVTANITAIISVTVIADITVIIIVTGNIGITAKVLLLNTGIEISNTTSLTIWSPFCSPHPSHLPIHLNLKKKTISFDFHKIIIYLYWLK